MTALHVLNADFRDLLVALADAEVEFVLVGAYALAVHAIPRSTGDIDVFVRADAENARRVVAALDAFGAPLATLGVTEQDFSTEGLVVQIGLPPRRIDILTVISGVTFDEAWASRVTAELEGREIPAIGIDALIRNKRSTGRPSDLDDVRRLERLRDGA